MSAGRILAYLRGHRLRHIAFAFWLLAAACPATSAQGDPSPSDARAALEKAGAFFRDHLGVKGTYVWRYSPDGKVREGEGGRVPDSTGWVQPPGTPAVGAAFLRIFEVTDDKSWLDAAETVAMALVDTQLVSGGWFYAIETDPEKTGEWCYRANPDKRCRAAEDDPESKRPERNRSVLDDDNTQSVLRFLIWFDRASDGADPEVRESIDVALRRLMKVQYPNGAFSSFFGDDEAGYDAPTAAKASIPVGWSHEWEKPNTPPYFIVNDNLPRDMGRLFLAAYRLYDKGRCLEAAKRVGDFLVAAQLPAPQQGWGQQYDRTMQPVWGRKFEPPGVVSRETAGSIDYLIELYGETGERKYIDAARSAAEWLKASRLPDGSWARYYELNTNRPLYVDNDNKVTFEDRNLLDHYGMKGHFDIDAVLARLARTDAGEPIVQPPLWIDAADRLDPAALRAEALRLVETQDAEGRWIDAGWIEGSRFVDGVFTLARFISAAPDR